MSLKESEAIQGIITERQTRSIDRKGGVFSEKIISGVTHFASTVRRRVNSTYRRLFWIISTNGAKADPIFQMTQDFAACVVVMMQ